MRIVIETIPHDTQDYPTVGNWKFLDDGSWLIQVSKMGDWRYEFLVALHEMIEMADCKTSGVSEEKVTDFDLKFEAERAMHQHGETDEPGDDSRAPYRKQHFFATNLEALTAGELGVDWAEYEKKVNSL